MQLLSQFVEAMDLTDPYDVYERINSFPPGILLKIVRCSYYMNGDEAALPLCKKSPFENVISLCVEKG